MPLAETIKELTISKTLQRVGCIGAASRVDNGIIEQLLSRIAREGTGERGEKATTCKNATLK